jgi:hypothetical protein
MKTATELAQQIADQELSLKQQALEMLDRVPTHDCDGRWYGLDLSLIRCALEQLND